MSCSVIFMISCLRAAEKKQMHRKHSVTASHVTFPPPRAATVHRRSHAQSSAQDGCWKLTITNILSVERTVQTHLSACYSFLIISLSFHLCFSCHELALRAGQQIYTFPIFITSKCYFHLHPAAVSFSTSTHHPSYLLSACEAAWAPRSILVPAL